MDSDLATRRKVLIIDDNFDAAETLALLLEAVGYIAVFRTEGACGIALAKEWLPDAILLDIGMPIMDGFEVALALRQCPELDQCRIIALTAWSDQRTVERAASCGFDGHIAKPASLASLVRELER